MARIEFDSVKKYFNDTVAIENINFEVDDGEFAILLGPSGCGKTTTLRCLAGLTAPTSGSIELNGYDVVDVHPKNRDIAMVFQNFALYPHMNVAENIGYPLKVAGRDKDERRKRVKDIADMLEISELLDREIANLSGGQRQRVALGRAVIRRPTVFLMDEPLANLDAKLKMSMRSQIKVLQRELGITTLYVTHDQEEAMSLGDKLIIMDQGNIQQIGTPSEVYHEPINQFVASFIGSPSMNFIDVTIDDEGIITPLEAVAGFEYRFSNSVAKRYMGHNRFTLGVRPQYFSVHTEEVENAILGRVEITEPQGDEQIIDIGVGDDPRKIELTVKVPSTVETGRGDQVWLTINDELVHGFRKNDGERISGEDMDRIKETRPSTDSEIESNL